MGANRSVEVEGVEDTERIWGQSHCARFLGGGREGFVNGAGNGVGMKVEG